MKQKLILLAILVSLLFCTPFVALAEDATGLSFEGMTPIWGSTKLTAKDFQGKVILLYYFTFKDAAMAREISATITQLNQMQQKGATTGAFTVVGSYIGADATIALNFFKKCRPMFPVYQNLISQEEQPREGRCSLVLFDSLGNVVTNGKMEDLMAPLKYTVSSAMAMKRMKNFPVPHPLDGLNLTGKEAAYVSMFDPGKPWQGAYKKIEKALEKAGEDSGSLESIKSAIDDYLENEIPKICAKAETQPAAMLNVLTMLSKSVKGLAAEQIVTDTLKPLQTDKSIDELSKLIFAINKFKSTSGKLKPAALKTKTEGFVAQVNKFLTKPNLAENVKAEATKVLEELGQIGNDTAAPVADEADAKPTEELADANPLATDQPAEDQTVKDKKSTKSKKVIKNK